MRNAGGQLVKIGDLVIADGISGVVVCDYDHNQALEGYENLLGSGLQGADEAPSSGVMIKTEKAGLVHYPEDDTDLILVNDAS